MMSCISFGWVDWGEAMESCKLKLWFAEEATPPDADADADAEAEAEADEDPWGWPAEMGACTLYTDFTVTGGDDGIPRDDVPDPVHRDAGAQLELATGDRVLPLTYQEAGTGGYQYQYWDCGPETFPFGEEMDLVVPGGTDALAVEGFAVQGALAFGPDVLWLAPDGGEVEDSGAPLDLAWAFDGVSPDVEGLHSGAQLEVVARVDDEAVARVACRPEDNADSITIPAEMVAALFADAEAQVELRLNINHDGPNFTLPWGRDSSARLSLSLAGVLSLTD